MKFLTESWAVIALFLTIGVNIILVLLNFRLKKKEIVFGGLKEIQFEFVKEWYLSYNRTIRGLERFHSIASDGLINKDYKRQIEIELDGNITSYLDTIALLKLVIDDKHAANLEETTRLIAATSNQIKHLSHDVDRNKLIKAEIESQYKEVINLMNKIYVSSNEQIEPIMRELIRQY